METKGCKCVDVKWECWIKEYDSGKPVPPSLWFSTECASCGATTFTPHSELDEATIPSHILERGLKGLKMYEEGK